MALDELRRELDVCNNRQNRYLDWILRTLLCTEVGLFRMSQWYASPYYFSSEQSTYLALFLAISAGKIQFRFESRFYLDFRPG